MFASSDWINFVAEISLPKYFIVAEDDITELCYLISLSFLNFSIFSLSKMISLNLTNHWFSVWYVLDFGKILLLGTGWYCSLKNLLNTLAFSEKLVMILPLTMRGGDYLNFFAIDKGLRICFWWRNGSVSLVDSW